MKVIKYLIAVFALYAFNGCAKTEDFDNTETKVGHSRVTFFPTLSLKGDQYMAVSVGGTFADPGSIAKEGDQDIQAAVAGSVNTATPGVYALTYTATNKDGFSVSERRFVAVYSTDATAAANDLSGNYARSTNGSVAVWTKLAPGVYTVFNPGGAPGTNVTVFVFNSTGFNIKIPSQVIGDGTIMSSAQESYTNSTPAKYTWQILNPGYGTGLRTFTKQ